MENTIVEKNKNDWNSFAPTWAALNHTEAVSPVAVNGWEKAGRLPPERSQQ